MGGMKPFMEFGGVRFGVNDPSFPRHDLPPNWLGDRSFFEAIREINQGMAEFWEAYAECEAADGYKCIRYFAENNGDGLVQIISFSKFPEQPEIVPVQKDEDAIPIITFEHSRNRCAQCDSYKCLLSSNLMSYIFINCTFVFYLYFCKNENKYFLVDDYAKSDGLKQCLICASSDVFVRSRCKASPTWNSSGLKSESEGKVFKFSLDDDIIRTIHFGDGLDNNLVWDLYSEVRLPYMDRRVEVIQAFCQHCKDTQDIYIVMNLSGSIRMHVAGTGGDLNETPEEFSERIEKRLKGVFKVEIVQIAENRYDMPLKTLIRTPK